MDRLYNLHKNDSDGKLQDISSNPNKYSQESVYVAKMILKERNKTLDVGDIHSKINYDENEIVTLLESIKRNTDSIRNILILFVVITIVGMILIFIN